MQPQQVVGRVEPVPRLRAFGFLKKPGLLVVAKVFGVTPSNFATSPILNRSLKTTLPLLRLRATS
jgi:hypothetical protein